MVKITRNSSLNEVATALTGNWGVTKDTVNCGRISVWLSKPPEGLNVLKFTSDEGFEVWIELKR